MIDLIKKLLGDFFAHDNSKVNTGTVFATAGFVTGWLVIVYYAFWLKQDIGENISTLLAALMGVSGTGFIATLFQKYGGNINIPPKDKQNEGMD